MKACEERNLVNATLADAVNFICDDYTYGGVAEAMNLMGEIFAEVQSRSSFDLDMWCIDITEDLSPKGRDFIFRLANWIAYKGRGDLRTENATKLPYPEPSESTTMW